MSDVKGKTSITQFRCQKCNAPYPLGADDVIATCPYCGFTFEIGGDEVRHLIVQNTLDDKSVREEVSRWLNFAASKTVGKGIVKNIEIEDATLQWIPAFRVLGSFESSHFGAKQESQGDAQVWRRIESSDSGQLVEWVVARRHAATFALDEFIKSLENPSISDFDIDMSGGAHVLNAEIESDDAETRAYYNRSERDREELLEKMDKLFDYRLNINVADCTYIHVPYWLVRYSYQKGTFRTAISGATGKVVLGELPITKRYRVMKWIASMALLISSALLMQGVPYILWGILQADSNDGDIFMIPVVMFIVSAIMWVGSVGYIGGVLDYEIEVNAEGEEREKRTSMMRRLKDMRGGIS
ncbi:MAG: hypothetical protein ACXAB5_04970 [Candidatus Thorarchaeota archaeon]|jgi:hypothetical protein